MRGDGIRRVGRVLATLMSGHSQGRASESEAQRGLARGGHRETPVTHLPPHRHPLSERTEGRSLAGKVSQTPARAPAVQEL